MRMILQSARSKFSNWLQEYLERTQADTPQHMGYFSYRAESGPIDGAGYGDMEDSRPDIVKEDEAGWQRQ